MYSSFVLCVQSGFVSVRSSLLDECGFTVFVLCSLWFLLDVFLVVPGVLVRVSLCRVSVGCVLHDSVSVCILCL